MREDRTSKREDIPKEFTQFEQQMDSRLTKK